MNKNVITLILSILLLNSCSTSTNRAEISRLTELDLYWKEVERCVREGDFNGYVATIHEEGILVSGTQNKSKPLAEALKKWQQEFDDTKSGKIQAGVTFRFNKRMGDATTAHETGMFCYFQILPNGEKRIEYIHCEALLIKKFNRWQILMEYQKSKGTQAEWDSLNKR